ncbi:hypothetical protein LshimejAT787_0406730 [Lyophyllum shimeji]|uniref:Uncharacterized protein n=1 Tax=Lyophyllum shimeji TaxID=47721 RepID=A0A9P3PLR9_LYOSH|nr:hypothetical protein LshimejAT787_0406730 [Lyophyllum shimeji]
MAKAASMIAKKGPLPELTAVDRGTATTSSTLIYGGFQPPSMRPQLSQSMLPLGSSSVTRRFAVVGLYSLVLRLGGGRNISLDAGRRGLGRRDRRYDDLGRAVSRITRLASAPLDRFTNERGGTSGNPRVTGHQVATVVTVASTDGQGSGQNSEKRSNDLHDGGGKKARAAWWRRGKMKASG